MTQPEDTAEMAINIPVEPTVFFARGLEADVRLHILDTEVIHVHWVVLKLHSAFFCKFLDSPHKRDVVPVAGGLKYEWITKVDEDGSLSLVAARDGKIESQNMKNLKGSAALQVHYFHSLIKAIYGVGYVITNITGLSQLTQMADYYGALRVLSGSLSDSLSHYFAWDWESNALSLLKIALKLRHRQLLSDSVVRIAGYRPDFSTPWLDKIPDPDEDDIVYFTVHEMVGSIDTKVATVQSELLKMAKNRKEIREELATFTSYENLPEYFRMIAKRDWARDKGQELHYALSELLEDATYFKQYEPWRLREHLSPYFLCCNISREAVPWDCKNEDW